MRSANYYVAYPGNTPENYPPTEACMINSKQHGVQNSGPWDLWLPVVESSRLFAQHAHSAGCAPRVPFVYQLPTLTTLHPFPFPW